MNVKELLTEGAARFAASPHCWITQSLAEDEHGQPVHVDDPERPAVCFCAAGMVFRLAYEAHPNPPAGEYVAAREAIEARKLLRSIAMHRLADEIDPAYPQNHVGGDDPAVDAVASWNDASARTTDDVVRMFLAAAAGVQS